MEVYIPWNNTWLDLPPLPDLGDGGGRMDRTSIIFMTGSGGGRSSLHLLGGSRTDWNIGRATYTGTVWRLLWDDGSQTYSWTDSYDPPLGKYLGSPIPTLGLLYNITGTFFANALAAGVPDNFQDQ